MFDQVACEDINQAFGQKSQHGSDEVGAACDITQWKTEVDQVGGDDVYGPAECY